LRQTPRRGIFESGGWVHRNEKEGIDKIRDTHPVCLLAQTSTPPRRGIFESGG